jgi:hypothetical protein
MKPLTCWTILLSASLTFASPDAGFPEPPDAGAGELANLPFTPLTIKKILGAHHQDIQNCYEETLAGRGKVVEGSLTAAFTIKPDGTVKDAKVVKKGTTLHDAKLHECVVSVLNGLVFPRPPDHRDHPVEYPLNLKAIR